MLKSIYPPKQETSIRCSRLELILPKVKRRSGLGHRINRGRGFSKLEIHEVGLSVSSARRLGIIVDTLRKTKHQGNVDRLKELLKRPILTS
ncbi:MAG: ribosomal protein L13e [Candidatus Bathyarchaeia archaeon]